MRVIAGLYKRRQLKAVPGAGTRPTTDKNKESLFNIIGPYFDGDTVLDLFGGSGALGIEAMSRGAGKLYVFDKDFKAFKTIRENIQSLGIEDARVMKMDYRKALAYLDEEEVGLDLVFLDPPYGMAVNHDIVERLKANGRLNEGSVIVVEDHVESAETFDDLMDVTRDVTYGITRLQILTYKGDTQ